MLHASSALAQINWPAFRGGADAGTSAEKGLPDTWSKVLEPPFLPNE
jgi:hypothetical protein